MSKTDKARLLLKQIKDQGLEHEVLNLLLNELSYDQLPFELMYVDGERANVRRPGEYVKGIVYNDVFISMHDIVVRTGWNEAKTFCEKSSSFFNAEMQLMPVDLHLEEVFESINRQFRNIGGYPFSYGWYWTDQSVNEEKAIACNLYTGELKEVKKTKPLSYRPCFDLRKKK